MTLYSLSVPLSSLIGTASPVAVIVRPAAESSAGVGPVTGLTAVVDLHLADLNYSKLP